MKLLNILSKIAEEIEISHAWFTTFSFSPSFFEKYVLGTLFQVDYSNLRRLEDYEAINENLKNTDVKVFYDPAGLNTGDIKKTVCDYIPTHAGLNKLKGMKGLFHPKVCLIYSKNEKVAYLITGSANLTHQGWGDNYETVFADEIDRENGELINKFFLEFFPKKMTTLPKNWFNKLKKEKSDWTFKYTISKSSGNNNKVLLDNFADEKELYVWSPYISNDMIVLKEKIIKNGEIHIVPGFKNGKIILSKDDYGKLKEKFSLKKDNKTYDENRFNHGKLWVNEDKVLIGSWNFTKAAICGDNFEAGVIVNGNFKSMKNNLDNLKITDNNLMTDNELEEEQLPEPIKMKLDCSVIADWNKREYLIETNTEQDITIYLPDRKEGIKISSNEFPKNIDFANFKKVGTNRIFVVEDKNKNTFHGFIQEINTDCRPVYGYDNLNDLFNNFSLDSNKSIREGKKYIYEGSSEDKETFVAINSHNSSLNYYSIFYTIETIKLSIANAKEMKNIKEFEKEITRITYAGASSVEQLKILSENWINNNIVEKTVMSWFLFNEINKIIRKINRIRSCKSLHFKKLETINLNNEVNEKFKEINNIEEKWIKYAKS